MARVVVLELCTTCSLEGTGLAGLAWVTHTEPEGLEAVHCRDLPSVRVVGSKVTAPNSAKLPNGATPPSPLGCWDTEIPVLFHPKGVRGSPPLSTLLASS